MKILKTGSGKNAAVVSVVENPTFEPVFKGHIEEYLVNKKGAT